MARAMRMMTRAAPAEAPAMVVMDGLEEEIGDGIEVVVAVADVLRLEVVEGTKPGGGAAMVKAGE